VVFDIGKNIIWTNYTRVIAYLIEPEKVWGNCWHEKKTICNKEPPNCIKI